nr:hypothetical protein [Burkholderia pseudomallei]
MKQVQIVQYGRYLASPATMTIVAMSVMAATTCNVNGVIIPQFDLKTTDLLTHMIHCAYGRLVVVRHFATYPLLIGRPEHRDLVVLRISVDAHRLFDGLGVDPERIDFQVVSRIGGECGDDQVSGATPHDVGKRHSGRGRK